MKKRILALLLATIMVIGTLAGCSNGGEGKDTTLGGGTIAPVVTDAPDTDVPDTTAAPDTTKAPDTTAAPDTTKAPDTTAPIEEVAYPAYEGLGALDAVAADLELDYNGLLAKYGKLVGRGKDLPAYSVSGSREFEGGVGTYVWRYGKNYDQNMVNLDAVGKVRGIYVGPSVLFPDVSAPVTIDKILATYPEVKLIVKSRTEYSGDLVYLNYKNIGMISGYEYETGRVYQFTCGINNYPDSPVDLQGTNDTFFTTIAIAISGYLSTTLNIPEIISTISSWSRVKDIKVYKSENDRLNGVAVTEGEAEFMTVVAVEYYDGTGKLVENVIKYSEFLPNPYK